MTDAVLETTDVTVLLVDDNPQNLKVLYETLKDKGYRLLIANDGEKAPDLAHRHQPEVILLDIMMPELDGYQVCERLKADPVTSDSAVVFLSALDDLQAKVRGFSLGGADYISKPFQAQEVIARVKTHARVIRLERALQARNRQLENDQARILNSISEGIYGLDARGTIVFANPAAALIMRRPVEELIGEGFSISISAPPATDVSHFLFMPPVPRVLRRTSAISRCYAQMVHRFRWSIVRHRNWMVMNCMARW